MFYQLALRGFGKFRRIPLRPPLSLRRLVELGLGISNDAPHAEDAEDGGGGGGGGGSAHDAHVRACCGLLCENAEL